MASGVGWEILNVEAFRGALDRVIVSMDRVTEAAVMEAAEVLKTAAMTEAPRRSGALADSMRVLGPRFEGDHQYSAMVGPTAPYGRRIELGYRGRGTKSGKGRSGRGGNVGRGHQPTPKEPFVEPSLMKSLDAVAGRFFSAWRRGLGR